MRSRKAIGGVSKLTEKQKQKLRRLLRRCALACVFETERWTMQRVAELIQKEFQVAYHPNYLDRLLAKLGFSQQMPMPQAIEQGRELVQAWLERDLPRVKKLAAAQRRNRVLG